MLRGLEKGNGTRLYRALVVRVTTLTLTLSERGAVGGNTVTCSDLGCIPMAAEGETGRRTRAEGGQAGKGPTGRYCVAPVSRAGA